MGRKEPIIESMLRNCIWVHDGPMQRKERTERGLDEWSTQNAYFNSIDCSKLCVWLLEG